MFTQWKNGAVGLLIMIMNASRETENRDLVNFYVFPWLSLLFYNTTQKSSKIFSGLKCLLHRIIRIRAMSLPDPT